MKQTIQIADKPTLDEVKSLLENSGYGLEALKKIIEQGSNQVNEIDLPFIYYTTDTVSGQTNKKIISFTNKCGVVYLKDDSGKVNSLVVDGVSVAKIVFSTYSTVYRIPFSKSIDINIFGGGSTGTVYALARYK